jgi:hypothetical protein
VTFVAAVLVLIGFNLWILTGEGGVVALRAFAQMKSVGGLPGIGVDVPSLKAKVSVGRAGGVGGT